MWHKWWKTRLESFHRLQTRRALASAVSRWHLEVIACRSRRLEAIQIRGSRLLRKCLLALADNAHSASILRRFLESYRRRVLSECLEEWRTWLFSVPREKEEIPAKEGVVIDTSARRHNCWRPGKARKAHCRCVYAVGHGRRCACAPRSHLLRRVEELHRLVAKGLDGRQGGYRLLSHVVQRADVPSDETVCSSENSSPRSAFDRRGKSGSRDCQEGAKSPCAQLVGGGSVSGSSVSAARTRLGKKLPVRESCKRDMFSLTEGPESCRAIATEFSTAPAARHVRVVDGQINAFAGARGPR